MPNLNDNLKQRKIFFSDPINWCQQHDVAGDFEMIKRLHSQRQQCLAQQVSLKENTGKLSRQIGEAKKAGVSAESLIQEMKLHKGTAKTITAEIRQCEQLLLEAVNNSVSAESQQAEADIGSASADLSVDLNTLRILPYTPELLEPLELFLDAHNDACVYHHPRWAEEIGLLYGHQFCTFVAKCELQIVGVVTVIAQKSRLFGKNGTSLPYFNYGGPIAISDVVQRALLQQVAKFAVDNDLSCVEYRCTKALPELPGHNNKVSMHLDLPSSAEDLWKNIGSKVRAQIKKAEKHNFSVTVGGAELLDDFYEVFAVNMRDLGTPVYGKDFFKMVFAVDVGKKNIVVVRDQSGRSIAASFLVAHKNMVEVPWASTLRAYNKFNTNMLLYWHMLKFACDNNYQVFDFGRSTVDASTYKFKKQWGCRTVPLYWHYWLNDGQEMPSLNPNNPKFKLMIAVWQRLPVRLSKILGPRIVKNLP